MRRCILIGGDVGDSTFCNQVIEKTIQVRPSVGALAWRVHGWRACVWVRGFSLSWKPN